MWSGIIIITGMVLAALLVFIGIAVWYSIRKQEIEVEKMRAKVVNIADMLRVEEQETEIPKVEVKELKEDEDERN